MQARAAVAVAWANALVIAGYQAVTAERLIAARGLSGERLLLVAHALWVALAVGALAALLGAARRELGALVLALLWWVVLVDQKVYALLGVHLFSSTVLRTLGHERIFEELQLGAGTLILAALLLSALFAAELFLLVRLSGRVRARPAWLLVALMALAVALAGSWEAHARAHAVAATEATLEALPFAELPRFGPAGPPQVSYPQLTAESAPRIGRPFSILFIQVESLRADMLADHMPRLRRFQEEQGTIRSARHFAGGHATEYVTFNLLYGLGADRQFPFMQTVPTPPSLPLSLFKLRGYTLRGASASFLSNYNASGKITAQLDEYREFLHEEAWKNDRQVVEYARKFAGERDGKPFFLFLFFNSTHHPYLYPPELERHLPVISPVHNYFLSVDERDRRYRGEVKNRYLNAVEYEDSLIGEVLDLFAGEIARGELAVVVTGDHGEELWDSGLYGHAAPTLTNARIQVPLVLHLPGEKTRELAISTHADVMPTLLDALRLEPPLPESLWSTGISLLSAPPERPVLVHASGFPYGDRTTRVVCVIDGQRKLRLEREWGPIPRFILVGVTDLEDRPLPIGAEERALARIRSEDLAREALRFTR